VSEIADYINKRRPVKSIVKFNLTIASNGAEGMMKQVCNAFLLVLLGLSGVAQELSAPKVAIPLIASGSHHKPTGVTAESLVITDQKTTIARASLLRGADFPVELGILIDSSRSQRDAHLDDILKATKQFVDEIIRGPEDRVFFLTFDATAQATEWLRKDQLQGASIKVGIGGGTALYDALAMACQQRMGPRDWSKPTRRVLLLISDGEDNLSRITRVDAVSEAIKAGVVIFTINTGASGKSLGGERAMENLSTLIGGESFSGVSRKVFVTIQESIDGIYYLSYVPPDAAKSAVHKVEVKPAPKEEFKLLYPRTYSWNP
jgi:VWFA-related protein